MWHNEHHAGWYTRVFLCINTGLFHFQPYILKSDIAPKVNDEKYQSTHKPTWATPRVIRDASNRAPSRQKHTPIMFYLWYFHPYTGHKSILCVQDAPSGFWPFDGRDSSLAQIYSALIIIILICIRINYIFCVFKLTFNFSIIFSKIKIIKWCLIIQGSIKEIIISSTSLASFRYNCPKIPPCLLMEERSPFGYHGNQNNKFGNRFKTPSWS